MVDTSDIQRPAKELIEGLSSIGSATAAGIYEAKKTSKVGRSSSDMGEGGSPSGVLLREQH